MTDQIQSNNKYTPAYGDLTQLNTCRLILDTVGKNTLEEIASNYISLLGHCGAIYEINGDYALGMFSSEWCQFLDSASRQLCDTEDNAEALSYGKWICHECRWTDASLESIKAGKPVDIECTGGIRLYAVPIIAGGKTVGALNASYGDPPTDPQQLQKISELYQVDFDKLTKLACSYTSRPPEIIEAAKSQMVVFAKLIGKIIEQKQTEEKLKKSATELELVLETSNVVIYRCQAQENYPVTFISENIRQQLGYSPDDFINDPLFWVNHIHPEDLSRVLSELSQFFTTGSHILEYRFKHKDGRYHWMLDKLQLFKDSDGKTFDIIGNWIDITEFKNMEIAVQKARNFDALGMLAGGIAHDFNNLLVGILGNIDLALLDAELKDGTKKLLSEAEMASLRAHKLTQQLLTFAKGGYPVKEASFLDDVIKDSAEFVIHGGKVACHYDIPEDLWLVDIDKGQMSQVVQNIVLNASHSMPEGGIVKITCENLSFVSRDAFPSASDGKYVKISIQDSGVGMPANIVEKIFDPYFSTKNEGSGLGLAITQSIINKHSGHVSVESSPGVGSTFTIYLPASKTSKTEKQQETLIANKASFQAKILVMDDEEMLRTVAKEMLVQLGHEVVLAVDGEEAVKLYQESMNLDNRFDIIIMDLTIPGGMGGEKAVKQILNIDPNAKVIVSSGYSNDPIMVNFKDYGFCSAIVKPYQLQELSRVISQLMG